MPDYGPVIERFRSARRDPTLAVVEGFHALKHALRFGAEVVEAVGDAEAAAGLARDLAPDLEEQLTEVVTPVPAEVLAAAANLPPVTGAVALVRRPPVDPDEVLTRKGPVVFLEGPRHAGNVGAAIRVAAAADAGGVLTSGSLDPWDPAAIRGSAGLHFALPVARVRALPRTGRPLVALDPEGEPLRPAAVPGRPVVAFGTERAGLSSDLLARADVRLRIPMRRGISSLNLATAVAVTLYAGRLGDRTA